eukprot:TRINITY_DN5882_c0_g1_i1.p1 TRINITY_DN5882_c0_g1~~TRINITY_DN5882_c0_g1_i1.p1  ORF type:complete len:428 (+),score=65.76 TRINITY_DN5882_c0_g1_i1:91-1284(+)
MLQIHRNKLKDLLLTGLRQNKKQAVKILSLKSGATVTNQKMMQVHSLHESLEVLQRVSEASGTKSVKSNRSHRITTVYLSVTSRDSNITTMGQLNFIDLASCEQLAIGKPSVKQKNEAVWIQRSLTALGDVLMALGRKRGGSEVYIPYRNSKLTQLLQSSLENCVTYMIVNISPSSQHVQETLSTLNFAKRVKEIKMGEATTRQMSKNFAMTNSDVVEQSRNTKELKEKLLKSRRLNKTLERNLIKNRESFETELKLAWKKTEKLNEIIGVQSDAHRRQAKALARTAALDKDVITWKCKHDELLKRFNKRSQEAYNADQRVHTLKAEALRRREEARAATINGTAKMKQYDEMVVKLDRMTKFLQKEKKMRKEDNERAQVMLDTIQKQVDMLNMDNMT